MSRTQRLSFLAIASAIAVIAVIVFAAAGGDDDGHTTSAPAAATPTRTPDPTPTEIVLEPGTVRRIVAKQNDRVRFTARSEKADEVHVHGYNIKKDVAAGGEVAFSFKAGIAGIFEIELEDAGEQIGSLVIEPN